MVIGQLVDRFHVGVVNSQLHMTPPPVYGTDTPYSSRAVDASQGNI